ncbi:MAG TPA: sugar nucleotide-binding protein [Candidatus Acidoferrum sp.]|jgi:dTDP-4-dehydrorhamnose reductase|nr:sugar nucleotide-binding protein [Candidatus Acidoferrum sp.]
MILLLGADGYVGQTFARALRSRKDSFIPLSRQAFDYTRFEFLFDYVRKVKPDLVINAEDANGDMEWWSEGGKGNGVRGGECGADGSVGEVDRMEMLQVNVLLPQTVARVCSMTNTPWAHVSSGSIYRGATVSENGKPRLESDLSLPAMRRLFASQPHQFRGFTELDEPNSSFKFAPCSFYSGTKALAEEAIREHREGYIWRLRLPFNHHDGPRNFLTKLSNLDYVCDAIHCLSHVDDCVKACLELWERRAAFGMYNVVNSGGITTGEVIEMMQRILKPPRRFNLLVYESQTFPRAGTEPQSGCLLDSSKLVANGIRLRHVRLAIENSLQKWQLQASQAVSISA